MRESWEQIVGVRPDGATVGTTSISKCWTIRNLELEAPPGFEPGMEVLQTSALPLGDGAGWTLYGRSGRV